MVQFGKNELFDLLVALSIHLCLLVYLLKAGISP